MSFKIAGRSLVLCLCDLKLYGILTTGVIDSKQTDLQLFH